MNEPETDAERALSLYSQIENAPDFDGSVMSANRALVESLETELLQIDAWLPVRKELDPDTVIIKGRPRTLQYSWNPALRSHGFVDVETNEVVTDSQSDGGDQPNYAIREGDMKCYCGKGFGVNETRWEYVPYCKRKECRLLAMYSEMS